MLSGDIKSRRITSRHIFNAKPRMPNAHCQLSRTSKVGTTPDGVFQLSQLLPTRSLSYDTAPPDATDSSLSKHPILKPPAYVSVAICLSVYAPVFCARSSSSFR